MSFWDSQQSLKLCSKSTDTIQFYSRGGFHISTNEVSEKKRQKREKIPSRNSAGDFCASLSGLMVVQEENAEEIVSRQHPKNTVEEMMDEDRQV